MGIFVQHPTDQQVWDSKVGSRAAYTRAYQAQERQQKLQTQRAANTTPDVTRSSSRFNPPDDPKIIAERQRLRASRQIPVGGEMQPAASASVIPYLDSTSEANARDGYFYFAYKYHTPEQRESGLLKFARALHQLPFNAVFQGKSDVIRQLALKLIQSPEAIARFAEKGWTA
jgi:hypothetical protein